MIQIIKTNYYDIESMDNVFTLCNYKANENEIDIFYLVEPQTLTNSNTFFKDATERIYEKNKNFQGTIAFYDLHSMAANQFLAKTFGLFDAKNINNPESIKFDSYKGEFRLVCDTDTNYNNEEHPYYIGYNSYNYDTTMLTLYFNEVLVPQKTNANTNNGYIFKCIHPSIMRRHNDNLFTAEFIDNMPNYLSKSYNDYTGAWVQTNWSDHRYQIRKNMLMTGRYIDLARLNEKQTKIALKRLLGMLGYQILESDKLSNNTCHITTQDELYDLIAYNVSDVVNLQYLFNHKFYKAQFDLKLGLLQSYPELIYTAYPNTYSPHIHPACVRKDRLIIDSSSAQFAAKALCPYGHLKDIPTVSFMYPSEAKAAELNIKRVNVLDQARDFFYAHFEQPNLRAQFDKIYNYYKTIEGRNFNNSSSYESDYINTPYYSPPISISSIPKTENCIPYFNKDGTPSTAFVNFSIGGIHGAEYNKSLYEEDLEAYFAAINELEYVKSLYPDPIDLKRAKKVVLPNGEVKTAGKFLKTGSTLKSAEYKDVSKSKPELFKECKEGGYKLNPNYVFTSAALSAHEDFTSYYPNLLRMLSAFFNSGLGYDRYAEIFDNKQKYGKLMKDKSLASEEKERYAILREGTKLILNSASGAADANYDTPIRMNNMIISMRIIGQLFSWTIGQAQTYGGATIISTNTDGLYSVLDWDKNVRILEEESRNIGVEIEPEPIFLISKDSNNRIEMNNDNGSIIKASGGTLSCHKGPDLTKALSHPAIIDWTLAQYLIQKVYVEKKNHLSDPFDEQTGKQILKSAFKQFPKIQLLIMFQNIVASSPSSMNYIFGLTDNNSVDPIILQHYNRVFIMKDNTPATIHIFAANARQITPATAKKRRADKEREQQHDMLALKVLSSNGLKPNDIPSTREAIVKKVTNIDPEWYMYTDNRDIYQLNESELDMIIDNLDLDKYLSLVKDCYEKNWKNSLSETTQQDISNNDEQTSLPTNKQETIDQPTLFDSIKSKPDFLDSLLNKCKITLTSDTQEETFEVHDELTIQIIYQLLHKQ